MGTIYVLYKEYCDYGAHEMELICASTDRETVEKRKSREEEKQREGLELGKEYYIFRNEWFSNHSRPNLDMALKARREEQRKLMDAYAAASQEYFDGMEAAWREMVGKDVEVVYSEFNFHIEEIPVI